MRILTVVGARPQFVKLAPVSRAIARHCNETGRHIDDLIVHTGQHYDADMSEVFFEQLRIPKPTENLAIGSGTHGVQTARMLEALERSMLSHAPDIVVVYGDTNSTLAASLAASKQHIPVAHVEAGLRSFDRRMPEEINRVVTDHVSDILFAPTPTAMDNLENENLADRAVNSGDVMLDAVLYNRVLARDRSDILTREGLEHGEYVFVTLHRPVNTDTGNLAVLLEAIDRIADSALPVLFPVHPRTASRIRESRPDWQPSPRVKVVAPTNYLDTLRAVDSAALVITDSGGLQKEAFFLGTPCLTARDTTEWPETIAAGANRLVRVDVDSILDAVTSILSDGPGTSDGNAALEGGQFGDGNAAGKIVTRLTRG